MVALELFQKELISLVSALVLALIFYLFRARAKLLWASPHGFTFLLHNTPAPAAQNAPVGNAPPPAQVPATVPQNFNIFTGSIVVANAGREPATEIEITFNWKPDNYNIWPARPHDVHASADNRYTLKFSNLAPKEQFQIELISPFHLPQALSVRCKECVGKEVRMIPMRVYPNRLLALFWITVLFGVAAVIYLGIKLVSIIL
ncbi:MAG TPA: hypothetical protein VJQ55_11450 [Candidatus Binatia bacterium]|nr:hypothetical protein [Candidatus Binatia bacterium]